MRKDPYQILKVNPSAKLEDIKQAYRKLVKIHHPDKGGDVKTMLEINAAWEVLKKKHKTLNLDKTNNLKEAAKNLYKILRKIKNDNYKSIAVEKIPNIGFGEAINDRLKRASTK